MVSYVPDVLKCFIQSLIPRCSNAKDVKIAAIGQALIQLARPNTILCPLLLALAVETHHKSGSEFVMELLHAFGFGSSIAKVREFEKSLYSHDPSSRTSGLQEISGIPLYSADNADVLQSTIDGKNTLHMMGIGRYYTFAPPPPQIKLYIRYTYSFHECFSYGMFFLPNVFLTECFSHRIIEEAYLHQRLLIGCFDFPNFDHVTSAAS